MTEARRVDGFPFEPILDRIFVCDYGQPDQSEGGIYLGDSEKDYGRYQFTLWRYGEVLAIGPGMFNGHGHRLPMPDIQLGDPVMFSRKHGSRLPGDFRYQHPEYGSLLIRVLDPEKCQAVFEGFRPWWNVSDSQLNPDGTLTG